MKTVLHHYRLDMDKLADKEAYNNLRAQLEVSHAGKFFNVIADPKKDRNRGNETESVELETTHLFNNQWNETTESGNRRLFDWYEGIYYNNGRENKRIKEGHWLELTLEMEAIRRETLACGYCGKQLKQSDPHKWHCEKCLGSDYLKETELKLLRLLPVDHSDDRRHYLTDEERAEILPLWKAAQGLGQIKREEMKKSKNRQKVADLIPNARAKAAELVAEAEIKTTALTWLLDNEINLIDNVIYYTHTKRFCFGWRNPLTADEKSKLLDVISEFPFDYDLK